LSSRLALIGGRVELATAASAADIIVSAQDGKFVRVDGRATHRHADQIGCESRIDSINAALSRSPTVAGMADRQPTARRLLSGNLDRGAERLQLAGQRPSLDRRKPTLSGQGLRPSAW
jgi:hypothetical protein